MREIEVSDRLYRHIEDAGDDDSIEPAMWRMVYEFERANSPGD